MVPISGLPAGIAIKSLWPDAGVGWQRGTTGTSVVRGFRQIIRHRPFGESNFRGLQPPGSSDIPCG
jgi:hypothetical protein